MKKFVLFLLLIIQLGASAEEIKPISLNEAIQIALENNLDYKSGKLNIDIAKNNIKSANRLQNPGIYTFWNFGKSGHGNPQQIGITQTIEIAKRSPRKKLAQAKLKLTDNDILYMAFRLKTDVKIAYIETLGAKTKFHTLKEQEQLLQTLLDIAKKRVEAGASAEIDVLQAKIALNQMTTTINNAKTEIDVANINFNKVLNVPNEQYEIEGNFLTDSNITSDFKTPPLNINLPDTQTVVNNYLERRFDIQIVKNNIEVAEKNLINVVRQRVPDIELEGGYGFQSKGMSDDGTFQNGGYIGANLVNIPVLYSFSPEIKNAKLELEQAQLNYDSTKNKAAKDIQAKYEKFLTSRKNLNYYNETLLKESAEFIRLSKRSYEVGKSNLTTLIVMEQNYRDIILGYSDTLAQYYTDWLEFLLSINQEEMDEL
jgi:outer membrane protein TolC